MFPTPRCLFVFAGMLLSTQLRADLSVEIHAVDEKGVGASLGTVMISESPYGVVFTPKLKGLPAGVHGFHVHQNPSCAPGEKDGKPAAAITAGDHYDPDNSKHHDLPWAAGHRGDLPALIVDAQGNAEYPVLAPRLKLTELHQRSLMVHMGGDNHADHPAPSGGGGTRLACGVIE